MVFISFFRRLLSLCTLLVAPAALATVLNPQLEYYPQEFYQTFREGKASGPELKALIFRVLSSAHLHQPGQHDELREACLTWPETCYKHRILGYKLARQYLFGLLHLREANGEYQLDCVYCEITYTNADFREGRGLGPMKIPDGSILNAEHTWPQSKFNKKLNMEMQKSDLHALFPATAEANKQRSNHPFGLVVTKTAETCSSSSLGTDLFDRLVFEPPAGHRGNVARALFYFAVRYQMNIPSKDESVLRLWHTQDPVDELERQRNQQIFDAEKVRNPFIDHPEIVDDIGDL